jgi:hypothetical protein
MSRRWKLGWLVVGVVVLLSALDFARIEFRRVSFTEAREMANREFAVWTKIHHLQPTNFGSPRIKDREDEWLFDWQALKGEGKITVIVRRNGEIFSGGDERLELHD